MEENLCLGMVCAVCGGESFAHKKVLWEELIVEWELSEQEVSYINQQQGCYCCDCGSNLRSIALAKAILSFAGHRGEFDDWTANVGSQMVVLEINRAGTLSPYLSRLKNHRLVSYPACDMQDMKFESNSTDLIVHSDTLEHVEDARRGLRECQRILRPGGSCIYTVPTIVGRLSRLRAGMNNSYHGSSEHEEPDQLVHVEFGADAWTWPVESGFDSVEIHNYSFPAAFAIEAKKHNVSK